MTDQQNELDQIKQTEKELLAISHNLEVKEAEIAEKEAEILTADQLILKNLEQNEQKSGFAKRFQKHAFLFSIIITAAVVLVWRGITELSQRAPILSSSIVALVLGVLLLYLINRYTQSK